MSILFYRHTVKPSSCSEHHAANADKVWIINNVMALVWCVFSKESHYHTTLHWG